MDTTARSCGKTSYFEVKRLIYLKHSWGIVNFFGCSVIKVFLPSLPVTFMSTLSFVRSNRVLLLFLLFMLTVDTFESGCLLGCSAV
jgi:hypothetical protein